MQKLLRLHISHILQVCSLHTTNHDAGVPARGLNGEAYRGHVFWDELYVFRYLTSRLPEITRELLMYRYRRLGEARAAAREAGYAGAMFPWQSGVGRQARRRRSSTSTRCRGSGTRTSATASATSTRRSSTTSGTTTRRPTTSTSCATTAPR